MACARNAHRGMSSDEIQNVALWSFCCSVCVIRCVHCVIYTWLSRSWVVNIESSIGESTSNKTQDTHTPKRRVNIKCVEATCRLNIFFRCRRDSTARPPSCDHVSLVPALLSPVVQVKVDPLQVRAHEIQLSCARRRRCKRGLDLHGAKQARAGGNPTSFRQWCHGLEEGPHTGTRQECKTRQRVAPLHTLAATTQKFVCYTLSALMPTLTEVRSAEFDRLTSGAHIIFFCMLSCLCL